MLSTETNEDGAPLETTRDSSPDTLAGKVAVDARRSRASYRKDQTLLDAVDTARSAAETVARPEALGEHVEAKMVGERLATHRFACEDQGYPGWFWEVTLARAPRSRKVTVCEIDMAPGPDALLAPKWIPWRDRLEPSDISRTDVLPYEEHDARLQGVAEETMDVEDELAGLDAMEHGRPRVLSQYGLDLAADRWYGSARGPVPGVKPDAMCSSCGFLLKLRGTMGSLFGVCANEWSPDDGAAVSFDHSCGAHSETDQPAQRSAWPLVTSRLDDSDLEIDWRD